MVWTVWCSGRARNRTNRGSTAVSSTTTRFFTKVSFIYTKIYPKNLIFVVVGVSLVDPLICWLPWWAAMPGSKGDMHTTRLAGLQDHLGADEWTVRDKGYIGITNAMVPNKGRNLTYDQRLWNSAINSVRVEVERCIHEIKIYNCLRLPWRHEITLHGKVFAICGHLANIRMRDEPIRHYPNPWLL